MIVSYQIEASGAISSATSPHAATHGSGGTDAVTLAQSQVTGLVTDLGAKASVASLAGHTGNTNNPHYVTAEQVGLANCNNTSDADKPVSEATQTALDAKASLSALTSHTGSTSNPHNVTKEQVGLANCDNTSDASKPISSATQSALDAKASATTLANHTGDNNNPHNVTKEQVGLANCDNTSDEDKPVSAATQGALDGKASLSALDAKADSLLAIQTETDDYTLVLGDAGKVILMNKASSNTLTVPPESSVPFATGTQIAIFQIGAGQTSIAPGSGVTILSMGSLLSISATHGSAALLKQGPDTWLLAGSLS